MQCFITSLLHLRVNPSILFVCSLCSHFLDCISIVMKKCAIPLSEPLDDHRLRREMVRRSWRIQRGRGGVEKGKFSYFGLARKFNSTLNFTQSGWLILFSPDLHFRPPYRVSYQTQFFWLEDADQCRRHTGRSSIAMFFSWTMPPSAGISLQL